jgi:hypothetical protein
MRSADGSSLPDAASSLLDQEGVRGVGTDTR